MRQWLWERVHGYNAVVWFFMGLVGGLMLAPVFGLTIFSSPAVPLLGLIFGSFGLIKFRRMFLVSFLICGLLLGLWRGSVANLENQAFKKYFGQSVEVSGKLIDDVTIAADGSNRFKLKEVTINSDNVGGEIWTSVQTNKPLKRSDTVLMKGFMSEGFGSFSASLVRAEIIKIIPTHTSDSGLVVRDRFAAATEEGIPEPQRSLGLGVLLGLKTALPETLAQQIQILGLSHIVVASGYNLTILVAFARRLFVKVSKYLSALVGASMIGGFMLITGLSPSMSRAGLVAGLSLTAWYYGRKIHPLTLLLVAAGVTLFIRPAYIWGDLGWYLSFTAFFGILVLAPLLHHFFWGKERKPSYLRELIIATFSAMKSSLRYDGFRSLPIATLSAQVLTLQIKLYSLGAYSWYALLANLLLLPVVPLAMLATFIAGVAGLIVPAAAGLLSLPATILLTYCTKVIDWLAGFPNVQTEITITLAQVFILYGGIILLTVVLMLKTKHNFLKDKTIVD